MTSVPGAVGKAETDGFNYLGWAAAAVLTLLGLFYIANGVARLVDPSLDSDFGMRWREQRYLVSGVNPYDVSVQFNGMKPSDAEMARITQHNLQNEPATTPSGYPPWGMATSFMIVPPGPLEISRLAFAAICILALGLTARYAYLMGRRWGTGPGLLLAAAVFGMFGNASTLRLGQYGLILNFFLLLSLVLSANGRAIGAGLAMAVAAMKPTFSILQIGVMFARKQWVSIITISVVCGLASLIPWMMTGINPIEMTQQMLRQSPSVTQGDTGLLGLARLVMPYPVATAALGLTSLAITLAAGWRYRHASALVAVSVAAIMGRLFMYHRQYDNVMLMFPLLTLGLLAFATRKRWAWIAFIVFGLSLWVPIPLTAYSVPVVVALSALWIAGGCVICWQARLVPPLDQLSQRIPRT
jgi:hypothetical protein